jgi:hypothetical protein
MKSFSSHRYAGISELAPAEVLARRCKFSNAFTSGR